MIAEQRRAIDEVKALYERHYHGDRGRRALFDAVADWHQPTRVLYPGSFIHVTASFAFPSVVYVDTDRRARRFFSRMEAVQAFVAANRGYRQPPQLTFHAGSYNEPLAEPDASFELLISLYAGFISQPCKRYLAPDGLLLVNNSHADAGLAALDSDYQLVAVVQRSGTRFRIEAVEPDDWFKPKRELAVTAELLRQRGRGIGYTKSAPAYLFRRITRRIR